MRLALTSAVFLLNCVVLATVFGRRTTARNRVGWALAVTLLPGIGSAAFAAFAPRAGRTGAA